MLLHTHLQFLLVEKVFTPQGKINGPQWHTKGVFLLNEAVEISPLLKMYSEYELASGEKTICSDGKILKLTFFGRTDLRISLSRAKFDVEVDFDVCFAVARQNRRQISEKQKFCSENFAEKKKSANISFFVDLA